MFVSLRNKTTGEIKFQKIGWSWTCLFFAGLLGIPLFVRRLNVWGGIMLLLWFLNFYVGNFSQTLSDQMISWAGLFIIEMGLSIFFALKANGMAGKAYLEHGWEFAEPDAEATAIARRKWGLGLPPANAR
jgi:hypothetical protein